MLESLLGLVFRGSLEERFSDSQGSQVDFVGAASGDFLEEQGGCGIASGREEVVMNISVLMANFHAEEVACGVPLAE